MSGPVNAVVGDDSFGTDLPQTQIPEEVIATETNMAKFSQSKEFQVLKDHIASRITFYQKYLPGQVPAENVPDDERGKYWAIANIVISELQMITDSYEQANQAVKDNVR